MTGLPAVLSRSWSAMCFAELGEFNEAIAFGEEAVRLADAVDHPFSLIRACLQLGSLYQRKGEFVKAIPPLERGSQVCETRQILFLFPWIGSALGYVYALVGRFSDGLPLLEAALEQDQTRLIAHQSIRLTYLGEAYLMAGRMENATKCAHQAIDLSRKHKERGHEAWAVRLEAEIASRLGPSQFEASEVNYRRAMAIAGELYMRPLQAHCHLGLEKLYRRATKRQEAQEHLTAATAMYRDMSMRFWFENIETEGLAAIA